MVPGNGALHLLLQGFSGRGGTAKIVVSMRVLGGICSLLCGTTSNCPVAEFLLKYIQCCLSEEFPPCEHFLHNPSHMKKIINTKAIVQIPVENMAKALVVCFQDGASCWRNMQLEPLGSPAENHSPKLAAAPRPPWQKASLAAIGFQLTGMGCDLETKPLPLGGVWCFCFCPRLFVCRIRTASLLALCASFRVCDAAFWVAGAGLRRRSPL